MKIRARPIVSGRTEGRALVSPAPFSFVGGVDPMTGRVLDPDAGTGDNIEGRVFVFPHGKGSTVGSYIIYGLAKRGVGPAAIVNEAADGIIAVGATLAQIPVVDRVDPRCLRSGDRLVVDGDRGSLALPDVKGVPVVSVVLRNRGRILIVRRSQSVGSFRGRWSAISGYLERGERPRERAVQEVREETGVRRPILLSTASPVFARDNSTIYVVHPFLFGVSDRRVRLDWENVEYRWIRPSDLKRYKTVPRLPDVVDSLNP